MMLNTAAFLQTTHYMGPTAQRTSVLLLLKWYLYMMSSSPSTHITCRLIAKAVIHICPQRKKLYVLPWVTTLILIQHWFYLVPLDLKSLKQLMVLWSQSSYISFYWRLVQHYLNQILPWRAWCQTAKNMLILLFLYCILSIVFTENYFVPKVKQTVKLLTVFSYKYKSSFTSNVLVFLGSKCLQISTNNRITICMAR